MNFHPLIYLVLVMIGYDLLIHLIYLFGFENFFLKRGINFWPEWSGKKYQLFWSIFWGTALLFLFLAMLV